MNKRNGAALHQAGDAVLTRELDDAALEVILPLPGIRTVAKGALAEDIRTVLDGGGATERLRALSTLLPWLEPILDITTQAVPVTARRALGLDKPNLLFIEVTGTCNERCVHCYADSGPAVTSGLDEKTVLQLCRDAAELGFRIVQFTGGDPLIVPFLDRAVALAKTLGLAVEIYTNGLLLSSARLATLAPLKPQFAFSLYSHRVDVHDGITRTRGSLQKTLGAIERVVAAELAVRVGIVAMQANHEHLDETLALLRGMGVSRINVTPSFDVGRGEHYSGPMPYGVSNRHDANDAEVTETVVAPQGKLCVTYTGDVVPCVFNRGQVLGRLAEDRGLLDILRAPRLGLQRKRLAQVMDEAPRQLQCGECRVTAAALELLAEATP